MNYLAHLYLAADGGDQEMFGSLLGDWTKGHIPDDWPNGIRRGAQLHRQIDGFTDRHPLVAECRALIEPPHRRYAGIILDMLFDHFLARDWSRWSQRSLGLFGQHAYRVLEVHQDLMPPPMQRACHYMIKDDWLGSYAQLESIERALGGIAKRLSRPSPLPHAIAAIAPLLPQLALCFARFFPEAITHYHAQREEMLINAA